MPKTKRIERLIPLERIFLHNENPRHKPYEAQSQVIEWLCANEEVSRLARDIAEHGLSPLDRFGVIRDHDTERDDATYIAAEGNRRLCALKLLTDSDLAPPERKAYFDKLAANWTPITELPCVIFEDEDDLDLWLRRRHHGPASGVGLKPWNSDQKARHGGSSSRNRVALAFLDYAEAENLISVDDRKRRLTTVQRFLTNPVMRETLGLDAEDPDNVSRTRPEQDFKLLSQQFIADMLAENPQVHSRQNSKGIESYARELGSMKGQSRKRIEPEPILVDTPKPKSTRRQRPGKAKHRQRLPYEQDIADALRTLGNWKLQNLYRSICAVPLEENTPLLAVGMWSFFETLTARAGRDSNTSFPSYLSPEKVRKYGLRTKQEVNTLREAVQRIHQYGNTTKHHDTAAAFNGDQLANDLESLTELILKVIAEASSRKKQG